MSDMSEVFVVEATQTAVASSTLDLDDIQFMRYALVCRLRRRTYAIQPFWRISISATARAASSMRATQPCGKGVLYEFLGKPTTGDPTFHSKSQINQCKIESKFERLIAHGN